MNNGRSIFSQIMDFLPLYELKKCIRRYRGDYKVQSFTCLNQFYTMAFAQLTYRESLRDIEACLNALQSKLYHLGIRSKISKSTLADANNSRDWRIYADFAQVLINIARPLYSQEDIGLEIDEMVYALDSTTIDLCLTLFPWAKFRRRKAAVKMHTLIDIHGSIPVFIHISDGKMHDVNILDILEIEAGSIYLVDRGYIDFDRLYNINKSNAFFISLAKSNMKFRRIYSHQSDISNGIHSDQSIALTVQKSRKEYPEKLRRIHFYDVEHKNHLYFLTNNFNFTSGTIAKLYKCRWQVELFFKWIKQHLRIKAFYGTSENAVKSQIWIAISIYVLLAIIKKRLNSEMSLYTILQVASVSLFEKIPINEAFSVQDIRELTESNCIQLNLFDL
ncbi:MAG: IS4 family transposase [Candidatus Latescibacteria bacterium]|nr:IS4 family transposase [Candidatus Latescibacterota bacterium]